MGKYSMAALSAESSPATATPKIAVQAVLDASEELGMVQQDADQHRLAS
jgi:hypothetical protein